MGGISAYDLLMLDHHLIVVIRRKQWDIPFFSLRSGRQCTKARSFFFGENHGIYRYSIFITKPTGGNRLFSRWDLLTINVHGGLREPHHRIKWIIPWSPSWCHLVPQAGAEHLKLQLALVDETSVTLCAWHCNFVTCQVGSGWIKNLLKSRRWHVNFYSPTSSPLENVLIAAWKYLGSSIKTIFMLEACISIDM